MTSHKRPSAIIGGLYSKEHVVNVVLGYIMIGEVKNKTEKLAMLDKIKQTTGPILEYTGDGWGKPLNSILKPSSWKTFFPKGRKAKLKDYEDRLLAMTNSGEYENYGKNYSANKNTINRQQNAPSFQIINKIESSINGYVPRQNDDSSGENVEDTWVATASEDKSEHTIGTQSSLLYNEIDRLTMALLDRNDIETERALRKARKGGGFFRKQLLRLEYGCALTGVSAHTLPFVVDACHIIPYSECDNEILKIHPKNGILLCSHLHRLFDAGHIGFSADNKLIISHEIKLIGILTDNIKAECINFRQECMPFLAMHREKFQAKLTCRP